jgi:PHP family Zn ribbon phosphoesterase
MSPEETLGQNGVCPECGKNVTVGVLHRVCKLADRTGGFKPKHSFHFQSLIPLSEVIAEGYGVGVNSKKVSTQYMKLIEKFGNEFFILRDCPLSVFMQEGFGLLAEALKRIREGTIYISPGYDGEYGTIKVFETWEKQENQLTLF